MDNRKNCLLMLANAYNNWPQRRAIAVLRGYVASTAAMFMGKEQVVCVEDVPRAELLSAMDHYYAHTDWSAFSRKDWQDAATWLRKSKEWRT